MAHKNEHGGTKVGLALATIAAVAGAYFLYGSKDAKKNRKAVRGWVVKAKGEVLEKIEQAKGELTEENYQKIVENVMNKYRKVKDASEDEIDVVVDELKSHWKSIQKHLNPPKKRKTTKKTKITVEEKEK